MSATIDPKTGIPIRDSKSSTWGCSAGYRHEAEQAHRARLGSRQGRLRAWQVRLGRCQPALQGLDLVNTQPGHTH